MSKLDDVDSQESDEFSEELSRIEAFISRLSTKVTSKKFGNQIIWSIGSLLLALVVAAVIMLMGGYDPGQAFYWLAIGAFSQLDQVFWYASPLILTGLAVALAFRCGLFNIGAEGQLYMGSMASALIAYIFSFPILLHPVLSLGVGILAGAAWGFVPGLLKAYRGAHEVVTSMMLSYTAILLTSWLVSSNGPFWDGSWVPQTPQFQDTALLPLLWGSYLHFGFIIAIAAVFGVDYLINKTVLGYELRAVGHNLEAAEASGINSKKNVAIAMGISGGLAGLAGSTEIIGTFDRFRANWSAGLGWDGITVAVLGHNNPWGVFAAGIFFGALKAGGNTMHAVAHVPIEMVKVIQGLLVLFAAAPRIIQWLIKHTQENKDAATAQPVKVFPRLLVAIFGLASVFLGLGTARVVLITTTLSPLVSVSALIFIVVAVIGVLVFIAEYSRDDRGMKFLLVVAIGWLLGGAMYWIGSGTVDITSLLMGAIAFLFWIMMKMLARSSIEEGDVQ